MVADDLDGLDDFGDELDSFMDGEDEGDSELDSFFEDLSTIDDLEVEEEEEEDEEEDSVAPEAVAAGAGAAAAVASEAASEPAAKAKKARPALLIPGILAAVGGIVLAILVLVALYFMNPPAETPVPEEIALVEPPPPPTALVEPVEPSPLALESEPPASAPVEPSPVVVASVAEPKPLPPVLPPPPPKERLFFVQVANCVYQECVNDHQALLKRLGHPIRVDQQPETTPMTEIVSRGVYGEEAASNLSDRINKENYLTGQAYRKPAGEKFRVSLGLFPDLDTANRVKAHLNQFYSSEIFFEARLADQQVSYRKVLAGGFKSREEATLLRESLLKEDPRFSGSFVVSAAL